MTRESIYKKAYEIITILSSAEYQSMPAWEIAMRTTDLVTEIESEINEAGSGCLGGYISRLIDESRKGNDQAKEAGIWLCRLHIR